MITKTLTALKATIPKKRSSKQDCKVVNASFLIRVAIGFRVGSNKRVGNTF